MIRKFTISEFFEPNSPVHLGFYVEHREMSMHTHEFWEISYVYEGREIHHLQDGKASPIRAGEFLFISPDTAHCITSPPPEKGGWVRVCNLLMTAEYIDILMDRILSAHELDEYALRNMLLRKEPFCIHCKDDSGSVYRLLMAAAHDYRHFTDGNDIIITNSALSLLIYVIRLFERGLREDSVTATKDDTIDDLIKYIGTNFGSNLSLEFLSAYVHLSPEYLSRYFKKNTGENLSDYITKTRIEKAKFRLRTSTWNISNISEYCGFGSVSSFQKSFKKLVGMTAGEYREASETKANLPQA